MKIRTRFLVSYLALALVPLLAMSVTFILVARRATSDLVRKELEGVARIQQKRLEYRMRQTYDRLAQVQSRTMLRQAMAEYKAAPSAASLEEIESSLRDATASLADFRNMSVLDNNGNVTPQMFLRFFTPAQGGVSREAVVVTPPGFNPALPPSRSSTATYSQPKP